MSECVLQSISDIQLEKLLQLHATIIDNDNEFNDRS